MQSWQNCNENLAAKPYDKIYHADRAIPPLIQLRPEKAFKTTYAKTIDSVQTLQNAVTGFFYVQNNVKMKRSNENPKEYKWIHPNDKEGQVRLIHVSIVSYTIKFKKSP